MSKYTVNYNCGHDGQVSLYGKHTDRDRKLEWLESQDCPKCAQKARGLECRIVLIANTMQIQFIGDTYPRKDEIKALGGYRFDRDLTTGYFSTKGEPGWAKTLKLIKSGENVTVPEKELADAINAIANAGLPLPDIDGINGLDIITSQAAVKALG